MDSKDFEAAAAQSDEGGPIAPVSPHDLRKMWEGLRKANVGPNAATEVNALGFDSMAEGDLTSLLMRSNMLHALAQRDVLSAYQVGSTLDDRVFQAAATMPCDRNDVAEAMIQAQLSQSPAEVVAQAKQEMMQGGYDITKPGIDAKFLKWLETSE